MLLPVYSEVGLAAATPCQIKLRAVLGGLPSQLTGPCHSNHYACKLLTSAGFCIFNHS
jgi:hypothetical protein